MPVEQLGIRQLDNRDMAWLLDDKYGMFIHWGLYAGPGRGEWLMHNEGIPTDRYRLLATDRESNDYFAADRYDPAAWAKLAKDSGMRWMCLTARHHDGYCLFDSPHPNGFSSMRTHGRDFVEDYVKACRAAGLKVGLYYSPLSWRYPGYYDVTGDDCNSNPFGYEADASHKDNARLMKEENYANVRRLVSRYGKIDHVFWDGGWLGQQGTDADAAYFHEPGRYLAPNNAWPIDPQYIERDAEGRPLGMMGVVRAHQPKAMVNPRYGWIGDYRDEEGGHEVFGPIRSKDVYQKCMTTAGAWGYDRGALAEGRVIKPHEIVEMLVNCVVRDMVLLLNVGPDRHGVIPPEVADTLLAAGRWIESMKESIYGTRGGPWQPEDRRVGYCYRGDRVCVHLMKEFRGDAFALPFDQGFKPIRANDLSTGQELSINKGEGKYTVEGMSEGSMPNRVAVVLYDREILPRY
ncbi:MAG TPA: alpha-L-fucosidase [Fimbriimonas sp.]